MKKRLLGALVASGLVFAGCEREEDEVMEERYEQEGTGGAAEQGSEVQQQRQQEAQEQDQQLQQHQQMEQQRPAE